MRVKPPDHDAIPSLMEFAALRKKMLKGQLDEPQTLRWLRGAFYFEGQDDPEWNQERAYKAALHPGLENAKIKVELV